MVIFKDFVEKGKRFVLLLVMLTLNSSFLTLFKQELLTPQAYLLSTLSFLDFIFWERFWQKEKRWCT